MSYGTAELIDGAWHIDARPHIAMRLKRVFGRVMAGSVGTLKIKSTDEVCRDLAWFCERFPLDVKQRDVLDERAARHKADREAFDRVISGSLEPRTFKLEVEPRPYQRVAAELWLRARGLLVADSMGLGKTCSAITGMSDPSTWPVLVVVPTHLQRQWRDQIKRFCPKLTTHIIKKGTPYDVRIKRRARKSDFGQQDLIEPAFPHVLIVTYHKLAGWADALAGKIKSVVFDEAQELRTGDRGAKPSAKYIAAKAIAHGCELRLGLSGTPIYNYGEEFYNVLSCLRPDTLGTYEEFKTEWCSGSMIKDPKAFGEYLRESGLMLLRTRDDVGRQLPQFTRTVHAIETDTEVLEEAESRAAELARIILSRDASFHDKGEAYREIDWRLRQATGLAKAPHVAAFVRMLVETGEKVVLFGWHRLVYDVWLEELSDFKPMLYTGSESSAQKEKAKQAFINGDCRVIILSNRSGSGLDGLQDVCSTVVYGELDWAWGVHEQGECRVFRDGQTRPVFAYYLVSEEGSDPVVSEVIGVKRQQLDPVLDPNAALVEKLSSDSSDGIKRLAERYLARKGESAEQSAPATQQTAEAAP
jgi:SNF2 family DNA or RNA helicase